MSNSAVSSLFKLQMDGQNSWAYSECMRTDVHRIFSHETAAKISEHEDDAKRHQRLCQKLYICLLFELKEG